jgi:hypothetical protein
MKKDGITFRELCDLLREVGFSQPSQHQNRIRFEHPATSTVLLFRAYNSARPLATVRWW